MLWESPEKETEDQEMQKKREEGIWTGIIIKTLTDVSKILKKYNISE